MSQPDEAEPCERCGAVRSTVFVLMGGTRRDRMVVCPHCRTAVSRAVFGAHYSVRREGRAWVVVERLG